MRQPITILDLMQVVTEHIGGVPQDEQIVKYAEDSISYLEFLMRVEEKYDVELPDENMTPDEMLHYINAELEK